MTQAVLITIIVCATIAFLGLCGIGVAIYAIKKGTKFLGEEEEKEEKK